MTLSNRATVVLSNVLFFNVATALACDPIDLDEAYKNADQVAVAHLFRIEPYDDASKFNLVFSLVDVLKGPYKNQDPDHGLASLTASVEIWSDPPSYFPLNEKYLLFLTALQNEILNCSQVIRLADYSADWYEKHAKNEDSHEK